MTSAAVLIVLLVGTAVGALTGVFVGTALGSLSLAVLAGFLGIIIGAFVRSFLMARAAGVGPDDYRTPVVVLVFGVVASLAASAGAVEVARRSDLAGSPVWIGTLAGLFAALLMAMLMITYYTHPGETPKLRR